MSITIPSPSTRSSEPTSSSLGVVRTGGAFSVITIVPLAAGTRVLTLHGVPSDRAARTSVQVGLGQHIDLPADVDLERDLDRYLWRFLNHSCDPNTFWRGRDLVTMSEIPAWHELTFDYNTTELEIAAPFVCACSSPHCRRAWVRGFAALDPAEQTRLLPWLARHLVAWRQMASGRTRTG